MVKSVRDTFESIKAAVEASNLDKETQVDIKVLVSMFERGLDTNGIGPDPVKVNLFYPRVKDNPEQIDIALFDVRAANNISIKFDFDRNGWVVYSNLHDPDLFEEQSDDLHEVAFVDAWPLANEPISGMTEQELKE